MDKNIQTALEETECTAYTLVLLQRSSVAHHSDRESHYLDHKNKYHEVQFFKAITDYYNYVV